MPWSNSVSRRYTPPTCTLEITATRSPLSQWSDRPIWKHVRFQLHFDDPRVIQDEQVTIRGDRTQLDALGDMVDHYVQRLLNPMSAFSLLGSSGAERTEGGEDHHAEIHDRPALAGVLTPPNPTPHLEASGPVDQAESASGGAIAASALPPAAHLYGIALEPRGLTQHYLGFGRLATPESGPGITLSTLQLFDLATALDEYRAEGLAIPNLNRAQWHKRPAVWGRIAAGFLVALALTPSLARLWDGSGSMIQSEVPTSSEAATSADQQQQIAARVDPAPGSEAVPIDPYALQTLPPPPPPGSVQPNAPANLQTVPIPRTPTPQEAAKQGAAPATPTSPPRPVAPPGGGTGVTLPQIAAAPPSSGQPSLEIQPEASSSSAAATAEGEAPAAIARSGAPNVASIEADPSAAGSAALSDAAESSRPTETAFDTIPQVAEVRQYFQQQWTPPDSLTQTLEYRLVLNGNGALQQVTPLGQASATYLDRTPIPLQGEAFVSPVENGGTPTIRLVLRPDGTVQTFLEAMK